MGRQLFLHHYLPAHLASALVTGSLLEFIFNVDPVDLIEQPQSLTSGVKNSPSKQAGEASSDMELRNPTAKRVGIESSLALWAASGIVLAVVIGGWWFFLPLTYGKPGLSPEEVIARKWLGYDLHFAK